MQLVWIVPLGLVVGVVLGALGGGGAILTVPILVYLLGQGPSAATTGSLVIVALASLAGLVPHWRSGNVRARDGLVFAALGVVGSLLGSRLNALVPAPVLMTAFAALMLLVAGLMIRKQRAAARSGDGDREEGPETGERRGWGVLFAAATGVGLLTGFFGVGGGFAVVPALVLALGFSMPVAVGTSLVVIVVNSATALLGRLGVGFEPDWSLLLGFAVCAAAGGLLGGRIVRRVDPQRLSLAFTILLVIVAGFMAVQNVPALLP